VFTLKNDLLILFKLNQTSIDSKKACLSQQAGIFLSESVAYFCCPISHPAIGNILYVYQWRMTISLKKNIANAKFSKVCCPSIYLFSTLGYC